jgi:hypothetical protein
MMFVGAFFAKDVRLDSDIKSLLPQKASSVLQMEALNKKAGGSYDLLLILDGGPLESRIELAKEFSAYLQEKEFARSVRYTTPKAFFDDYKYMFIPTTSLAALQSRIDKERKKHSAVTDPLGLEQVIEDEKQAAVESPELSEAEKEEQAKQEQTELDLAKELLSRLDEMRPYYQTEEGDFLAVRVIPAVDSFSLSRNRKLLEQFNRYIEDFDVTRFHSDIGYEVHGSIPRHIRRYESIMSDVSFGGWGLLLILFVVVIYFRSIWAILVLIPPLVAGLLGGMGVVSKLEGELNTIAIFLVLVVFGVGIEFGIHLWARMLQERKTSDLKKSLLETWKGTGRATVTSAVALLAGFALLTLSSFQGFAQFGRVAVILLSFVAGSFLIFMPSWICFVERLRKEKPWKKNLAEVFVEKAKSAPSKWTPLLHKALRVLSIILIPIFLGLCIGYLRFDYKFDSGVTNFKQSEYFKARYRIFTERLKPSAVAAFNELEDASEFMDFYRGHKEQYPDIALTSGLSTFYPIDQEERVERLQRISDDIELSWLKDWDDEQTKKALTEIKNDAYEYEVYSLDEVPTELKEPFIASDDSGDSLVYIFDLGGDTDGLKSMRFSKAVEQLLEDSQANPHLVSGQEIIFADIVSRVVSEGPWLVFGMLLLVFIICWIDFRRWGRAGITMLPVLFGFLLTGGMLVLTKNQINFFNMVALASLGSMVVDNSIHMYHRYLSLRRSGNDRAARTAVFAVAPTITTCTLTSILGYGGMLFANHSGINSLANVAVLGLICCLVSAVVFFPAWLGRFSRN